MRNSSDPALVIFGFNRPDFINKRLIDLSKVNLRNVHISIDFCDPTTSEQMRIQLLAFQAKHPEISHFSFHIHEVRQGLTKHITETISRVLEENDSIIVIEDDIEFNSSTIESLKFGLEILEKDSTIASIGCYSAIKLPRTFTHLNGFRRSPYFACWGWATTKDIWSLYNSNLVSENILLSLGKSPSWEKLNLKKQKTWLGRFNKVINRPDFTWDIQFQYMCFKYNLVNLLPVSKVVENHGFQDSRSTHTKEKKPRWMVDHQLDSNTCKKLYNNRFIEILLNFIESETLIGDQNSYKDAKKFLKRLTLKRTII